MVERQAEKVEEKVSGAVTVVADWRTVAAAEPVVILTASLGKQLSPVAACPAVGMGWMVQDWWTQVIGSWELQQKTQERRKLALGYL